MDDPELAFDRAMETYLKKGYTKEWINQRLKSIEVRKDLTDEWENRNIKKGHEFAILTDEITRAWSGFTTKQYKEFKELKKENILFSKPTSYGEEISINPANREKIMFYINKFLQME